MMATVMRTVGLALVALPRLFAYQTGSAPVRVTEAALRADASVYPVPEYWEASIQANHTGRVVIEVVVAPNTKTSPLARVQSTKVIEAPDVDLANAVLEALKDARHMPFFDESGNVTGAVGRVIWEFRIVEGKGEAIDPYAPTYRAVKTTSELAADGLRIAQRARQILSSQAVWNRADNRQCPPNAKTISLYCALEKATLEVTGSFDHRGTVMEDVRAAIDEIAPHHPYYDHWLMGYNNDPSTTFAEIQKLLRLTEDRIAKRINQ
jgi:hypothetical protein